MTHITGYTIGEDSHTDITVAIDGSGSIEVRQNSDYVSLSIPQAEVVIEVMQTIINRSKENHND